jgi:hypothetical protein
MPWAADQGDLEALRRAREALAPRDELSAIPHRPGECVLALCHRRARADRGEPRATLCRLHKILLRPTCEICGAKLTDKVVDRGLCGRCYWRVRDPEARRRYAERARRRRSMAELQVEIEVRRNGREDSRANIGRKG